MIAAFCGLRKVNIIVLWPQFDPDKENAEQDGSLCAA